MNSNSKIQFKITKSPLNPREITIKPSFFDSRRRRLPRFPAARRGSRRSWTPWAWRCWRRGDRRRRKRPSAGPFRWQSPWTRSGHPITWQWPWKRRAANAMAPWGNCEGFGGWKKQSSMVFMRLLYHMYIYLSIYIYIYIFIFIFIKYYVHYMYILHGHLF